MPKVRALCSAGVTQPRRSYDPVRLPPWPLPSATLRTLPSPRTGLPRLPEPPFRRAVPTTPADRAGARVDCFPRSLEPSPNGRRVGIRIVTFEACSGFTRVAARTVANLSCIDFCPWSFDAAVAHDASQVATQAYRQFLGLDFHQLSHNTFARRTPIRPRMSPYDLTLLAKLSGNPSRAGGLTVPPSSPSVSCGGIGLVRCPL